jgi:hypothetical protein
MLRSLTRRLIAVLFLCALAEGGQPRAVQAPDESLRFYEYSKPQRDSSVASR